MSAGGTSTENPSINMTPMIDVVFVLIIFFIVTVKMEEQQLNENIEMGLAKNSKLITAKDPRQIQIDVDKKGKISVNRKELTPALLKTILGVAVQEYGSDTPVLIVGDVGTQHKYIRKVMDSCSEVGIWKLKFMVLKETGTSKPMTMEQILKMKKGQSF